ncbi:trypsin-like cysteine/serine peptidase domain-containing protein [Fimicolochytrium jonesii]|uniref:trypsin-like cysteine/serine peptidase domain-containing protein n=1 Tax=Fimicolochytrium jonesii TaxID=1396493 RepID=UPI0022FDB400|nr:trypsin-like cysteine/serine peptidase domain-containing protein [Fimicolochytrium jonesii]KAI8818396.1 trypsin-like cysteine/serine peptidase domain-containing protein [Fimicolochytrium jonesii]
MDVDSPVPSELVPEVMADLAPPLPESGYPHKRKRSRSDGIPANSFNKRPENGALPATNGSEIDVIPQHAPQWQQTIEQSILSIVSIRFSQVASFDTDGTDSSEASGFVVDATRGLILTNRHVACAGPFFGEAVFHDHEEVDVFPVYRDPVHDFGILKFDPRKIRYMQVREVELAPHLARVGLDIRVVGNDAGEKLSILAGSISRLDRNAPEYGEMTYNDFNTFYLQAASSTSGGSSGSPVLNIEGKAVALQAGGHMRAATDFFFPLDRVARALKFIQEGRAVPRGTIQTQFMHRPFDEVRRLGLKQETEAFVRKTFPKEVGMLVAETVVPKGPASAVLEEGDILLSVNGVHITKFVPLESILDDSVGKAITVVIQRGGVDMEFTITVQDLHTITPDRYLEVGGAKLNDVSYQLARQFCVPVEGVYVAEPSGMFRLDGADQGWIISSIDTRPTPNLDAFIEAFKNIPDRERIPVEYYSILDVHTKSVAIVDAERHWSGFRLAVRNDKTGFWDYTKLPEGPAPKVWKPITATFATLDQSLGVSATLFHSLVKVSIYIPCRIEGFPKSRKMGAGLVLDAEKGLVVVGRSVVPYTLGDIMLTFADSIIIPGKAIFLHPINNFAIIQYDPSLLGATPVKSAPVSDVKLGQGHRVTLIALNHNQRPVGVETTVTDITAVTIPYSGTPRFRAINFDAITLDTPLAQQCSAGVLADSKGKVQGIWLSFLGEHTTSGHDQEYHLGFDINSVIPILRKLQAGGVPRLRGLAIEVTPVQMSQARHMGLSDEWVHRVQEANKERRQLFLIRRTENESATSRVLKDLDVILSVSGKVVTRVQELELSEEWPEEVDMVILRNKTEMSIRVPTTEFDNEGVKRVVFWAGAVLHEPHRACLQQSRSLPSKIYVSSRSKGSPAYMYGITTTHWIVAVNGQSVTTLDDFVDAVRGLKDGEYVRVKCISFDLVPCVLSVKLCLHYWPTSEIVRDPEANSGWKKNVIE